LGLAAALPSRPGESRLTRKDLVNDSGPSFSGLGMKLLDRIEYHPVAHRQDRLGPFEEPPAQIAFV
jgi:hypothetical protein